MKNIVFGLTFLGFLGGSISAAPFLSIGENAQLFLTANASTSYNDNIFLSAEGSETTDTVTTFIPGFDLVFSRDSVLKGSLIGTTTFSRYEKDGNLDNSLFGFTGNVAYDSGGDLKLNANASYNQLDQPTVDTASAGQLVNRHTTTAGVNASMPVSGKISAGTGLSYNQTVYSDEGYTNIWGYSVPVNIYYQLTPKVDVSTGLTYTRTELDQEGANQYDAYYYNVGARGAFTPKLSGSFSVGYNTRTANEGPDDGGNIGASASLAYAYSDKTQFSLSLSRDFSNSASGGTSYQNTQLVLGASNSISADWSVYSSITGRILDYQNEPAHVDYYLETSLGASYTINSRLSASLGYTHRVNTSGTGSSGDFSNNVINVSLSARY